MTGLIDYLEVEVSLAGGVSCEGTGYAIVRAMLLFNSRKDEYEGKGLMYEIVNNSGLGLAAVDHYHRGHDVVACYFFQGDQEVTLPRLQSTLREPEFAPWAAQIAQDLGFSFPPPSE